ncbi:MAG TPA: cupin domain-containing protein [Gemmatimonadales bacterium]|jgi:hypothetical protein
MRSTALAVLCLLPASAALSAQDTAAKHHAMHDMHHDMLTWGAPPPVFPAGAQMAVVSGDPGKEGMFTVAIKMPAGYRIMPHWHPTDETVEVKEGTFYFGMGDKLEQDKASSLPTGKQGTIKATMHHYAFTKGPATITVTAMGPFAMTYVNPADDPSQPVAKP